MTRTPKNSFGTRSTLTVGKTSRTYFCLQELDRQTLGKVALLPISIKVLLENLLRHEDGQVVTASHVQALLEHFHGSPSQTTEIPFMPSRVVLQDFTGVPAVVDLATMRDAMKEMGGDPDRINPLVRADLVIDHSVQVDAFGTPQALEHNEQKELERNRERYSLLKWAQKAFDRFTVVPPGRGIVHQVNLEHLASVVHASPHDGQLLAYPDTLVGTDSHTTMINGLGVVGWGVGGIEAEAVMLGQPYYLPIPNVVGIRLEKELPPLVSATDLVLHVTELLRKHSVVGKFVEFFGPGLAALSLPDRATLANMAPEYGATMGFFPIDEKTLQYLRLTGRDEESIQLVEAYARKQGLFPSHHQEDGKTLYSEKLTLDLSEIEPSVAGPKRPQDRIPLKSVPSHFAESLRKPVAQWGFGLSEESAASRVQVASPGEDFTLHHGSVVIAAITSCTNTSNPAVMIAAGLLAKNALDKGIHSKPWVKTSLAPGSLVVTDYLRESGLLHALEEQGFSLAGYGCTTCIGNSGPLPSHIQKAIDQGDLVAAAVLSGNRNFEGRIHGAVRANYLASPPLVVAYALAGRMDFDFEREPLGEDHRGKNIFLQDLWPSDDEVFQTVQENVKREYFETVYGDIFSGKESWRALPAPENRIYDWDSRSTYIQKAPFFQGLTMEAPPIGDIAHARVLLLLGDTVTTDHISPAGSIPASSQAGAYLISLGVPPEDFNSYGSRRGNHEVMVRGTFANTRIRNLLLKDVSGGFTRHFPSGEEMSVWEAAERYRQERVTLVVLAGREYGTGSSRDWAAKGTALLGVKAVIAESYERIHRSNLIGMGVLPLQFLPKESAHGLGLDGTETLHFHQLEEVLSESKKVTVQAVKDSGESLTFEVLSRLDTPIELEYYRHGGILPKVLRDMIRNNPR